ncbi:MAG: hypothetical protein M3680_33170, partial [Myxococcota bacterium]|nr:hypothetical protein [Myxococcota bacterium]
ATPPPARALAAPPRVPAAPVAPTCASHPNPAACPATEPNVNGTCKTNGIACMYAASCCGPLYVCVKHVFEARFTSC